MVEVSFRRWECWIERSRACCLGSNISNRADMSDCWYGDCQDAASTSDATLVWWELLLLVTFRCQNYIYLPYKCDPRIVLATVPIRRVGSGFSSDAEPNHCNRSYHTKTRTVAIGPVLSPKTRHYMTTIFSPTKYLSSDCIVTWSVGRLCSFSPSFTSRSQMYSRTNIRWLAIDNPGISPDLWRSFTAIQCVLVQSQIWHRMVKELLKLHYLHTDHIMIQSELKYLIVAKVAWTVIWTRGPGSTRPKNPGFISSPGNKPVKTESVGLLGGSWPGLGPSGWIQPGSNLGNPEPLETLSKELFTLFRWGLSQIARGGTWATQLTSMLSICFTCRLFDSSLK